jgi:hypothetical protein
VPTKKRKSGNRPSHRKGLSGNPQRRAAQLGEVPHAPRDRSALLGMARLLAGATEPAPWWADSHRCILARARTLAWPSDPAAIEELTCQVVGGEFFDRLGKHDAGFHMTGWLGALIEATGKAARKAVTSNSADWPRLWALVRGLLLITPSEVSNSKVDQLRQFFPGIPDPLETARAEAEKTSAMLTERGLQAGSPASAHGARPAGEALLARDAYGSRFLLTVPFGYHDGGEVPVDHWYAWDIDMCWLGMALSAGAFGSPEDALEEWSDAVGQAAIGSALAPCPEAMIPGLLRPFLRAGPLADTVEGGEPRPLIREYFRLRRRARAIAAAPASGDVAGVDSGRMLEEFSMWYQTRHGDIPEVVRDAAETIAEEWGPHRCPDEGTFYTCSPHRIRQSAILIRDKYFSDHANQALRVFPEWTQWCIDRTGLTGPAAERAHEAAAVEAGDLRDDAAYKPSRRDDSEPFRVQE